MKKKHTKIHYASAYVVDILHGEKPQMQLSQNESHEANELQQHE